MSVSIKALEIAEEKEAVAQYGSTDSGASLGDILGAALNRAQEESGSGDDAAPAEDEAPADDDASAEASDETAEDGDK